MGRWMEQPYETSLTVTAARPTYVDALARAAVYLSRRRGPVAATAAHAGESYMEALARTAARLAGPPAPDDPGGDNGRPRTMNHPPFTRSTGYVIHRPRWWLPPASNRRRRAGRACGSPSSRLATSGSSAGQSVVLTGAFVRRGGVLVRRPRGAVPPREYAPCRCRRVDRVPCVPSRSRRRP